MKLPFFLLTTALYLSALGAPTMMDFTPEQRKQMAEMHTKAAACLNSNKTIQECREEMMKGCSHMGMGSHMGCPMMGTAPQPEPKTKTTK